VIPKIVRRGWHAGTFSPCSPHGRLDWPVGLGRLHGRCRLPTTELQAEISVSANCRERLLRMRWVTISRSPVPSGICDHRSSQFSSGARSIPYPGVLELPCSCKSSPVDLAVNGFTACFPLPRTSLDAARTSFEPALNDLVSVPGFLSKKPKQTDNDSPGCALIHQAQPLRRLTAT
jgi:hypothetical protein